MTKKLRKLSFLYLMALSLNHLDVSVAVYLRECSEIFTNAKINVNLIIGDSDLKRN